MQKRVDTERKTARRAYHSKGWRAAADEAEQAAAEVAA